MVVKEILAKRVRLPIVLIGVVMAFGLLYSNADAAVVWSEDFDGLASGTTLTSANMPGWTFKGTSGGSTAIATTSNSAVSSPNAISHLGNGAARGAMFHDAAGVVELRFDFFGQTDGSSRQATTEIGFTSNQNINSNNGLPNATRVAFEMDSFSSSANPNVGFSTFDGNLRTNRWDLTGLIAGSRWYSALIRLNADNTVTFGYKTLADTDFTFSTGYSVAAGFSPTNVGATLFQHSSTNGRAYLDNIIADDGANVVPEPSSVVSWITLSLCGLAFAWRRRKRAA